MPSLPKSAPPTPICSCEGRGKVIASLERAEQEQLIILERYPIGTARTLALVPCICAAGAALTTRWRNLPAEAEGITFSHRLVTMPGADWAKARAAVEEFVAQPRGWLTLAGNCGTGKTYLVYAGLNELAKRGIYGRYLMLKELLLELQRSIKLGCYDETFARLVTAPLLVIDELDKYRGDRDWAIDVIETLFLLRYREARYAGTVLLYNLNEAERLPPFLLSRIRDGHFGFVELNGPDLRPLAAQLDPWDRGAGERGHG